MRKNRVDIFCRLSTMHERDRQTDQGTVTSILISVISFSNVAVNIVFSAIIIRCGLSRCSVPLQIRKFRCRLGKPAHKKTWRRRLFTSPRTRLRASRDLVMLLMTVLPPQPHSDRRWHHVDCLTLCNLRPTTTICVNTCNWVAMRSVATERYSVTLQTNCYSEWPSNSPVVSGLGQVQAVIVEPRVLYKRSTVCNE